jgi:two-component system sensor histidine kinase YesM
MSKWLRAYRHMKIRRKLSLLIALTVLVTFCFTFLIQQYAFSIYDGQLYDKSSKLLNLSSSVIETELRRIEQLSFAIATDVQIQKLLTAIKNSASEYDRHLLHQDVVNRLITYTGSESSVYSIQLFDAFGVKHDAGLSRQISPAKATRMIRAARSASGSNCWIYPDDEDDALISVREIRSYSNTNFDLQFLGTLLIRINLDNIVRKYAVGEGDLMLLSDAGAIYPRQPPLDPNRLADRIDSRSAAGGYFTGDFGGKTYFVAHIRSANTGWTYVYATPFNDIFRRVIFIKETVVAVFVALLALVLMWGIRFSRGLTRPIEQLIARMKLAEKGNFADANLFPPGDAPVAMDEIGLLQRTFRLMIERINALITENYAGRLLIKETEFKALQAQINPHFLYNTLESINWLAKINRQTQISQMVEALGFLLRHSVSLKTPLLTLGEEIEIARSYLTIQKFRFEDRLVFSLDVPEAEFGRPIPKLTLQPLLENAIRYALEPSVGACRIAVYAREAEDAFHLVVEDDGPGLPADTLERLRAGQWTAKGGGIGLANIDERIRIAFGDRYGIRVGGRPGRGARVTVTLPKETEVMNHVQSIAR